MVSFALRVHLPPYICNFLFSINGGTDVWVIIFSRGAMRAEGVNLGVEGGLCNVTFEVAGAVTSWGSQPYGNLTQTNLPGIGNKFWGW